MKKVSFGSFALTEVKKEDRKCLDRYLIKTFADNISISDAIRNLAITKNLMYITPDALMRDWLGSKQQRVNKSDRESNSMYEGALKRAFHVLREFYSMVSISPFYKEYVYYPIYIEKVERVTAEGSTTYDAKYTDVTMNYSFIVLANDLTKNLKIDEIRYDENASLNFLFLFVEFFSSGSGRGDLGRSIHDFNRVDYEFLVKLYQFTEKANKEPIQMVLDLYKIIGLLRKINDNTTFDHSEIVGEMDKFLKNTEIDSLKRYRGLLRHKFVELIGSRSGSTSLLIREAFVDIMDSIFTSEGLDGLYSGVDTSATRGERHTYMYNTTKYREVLNLAKELVEYNKLKCNDVVSEDSLDIDFRVENNSRTLDVKSGMAAQKYQTFFRDYVDSIKEFFSGMVTNLITEFDAKRTLTSVLGTVIGDQEAELIRLRAVVISTLATRTTADAAVVRIVAAGGSAKAINTADKVRTDAENAHTLATLAVTQQTTFIAVLRTQLTDKIPNMAQSINNDVVTEITDHLISSIVTDLTFVYDDGKRFFTNQLIAQGLIDLAADAGHRPTGSPADHDLTTFKGFEKAADNATTVGTFPTTIGGEPNPSYLAASVAASLEDAFGVMAKDTIVTFKDHVIPILQKHLQSYIEQVQMPQNNTNTRNADQNNYKMQIMTSFITELELKDPWTEAIMMDIEVNLHKKIFRNRFVSKVLKNFLRLFETKEIKQVLEHDEQNSQLHPLIKKLLTDGSKCRFFKSFIIDHDMIEQLYRLKYLTDTQKFLDGITHEPPRKLNDPMNRMQTVLHDYLGLKRNPTWILSKTNVYLSMPDDLSLTGTSILSNIPKSDLMEVCRIDPKDYWRGENMGEAAKIGNSDPKIKKMVTDISRLEDQIRGKQADKARNLESFGESIDYQIQANESNQEILEEAKSKSKSKSKKDNRSKKNKSWNSSKNRNDSIDKDIDNLRRQIDKKEEEIQRAISTFSEKEFLPNMSVFDDPYRSEKQEFISDQEKSELIGNRNKMEKKLNDLNPYDDADVREMEANQRGIEDFRKEQEKEQRSHPFDFEDGKDTQAGPQRFNGESSRESENEDWLKDGERSGENEFRDQRDQHGYDIRDRWRQ